MDRKHLETIFFVGLLLATLVVGFAMLRPFVNTLLLAAVLAFLFSPLHRRIARSLGSPTWSALLVTLLVLATVMVPLTLAGYQVVREAGELYVRLRAQADPAELVHLSSLAQTWLESIWPGVRLDPAQINDILQQGIQWLLANTGTLFAGFGRIALHFVFLLLFFFYLIRDGRRLVKTLRELMPLSGTQGARLVATLGNAISGTVRGSILVAVLQGLAAGVGFWLFGVPNPALWAAAVVAAAFIPTVGTALVQVPVIAFMAVTGETGSAVGLALWGLLLVSTLDNILKPKLIGGATRMHPLVAMVGVLGGITVFGPIGILIGPVVMAFLVALLNIYRTLLKRK